MLSELQAPPPVRALIGGRQSEMYAYDLAKRNAFPLATGSAGKASRVDLTHKPTAVPLLRVGCSQCRALRMAVHALLVTRIEQWAELGAEVAQNKSQQLLHYHQFKTIILFNLLDYI